MSDYHRGQLDLINSLLNLESLRTMSPEHVRLTLKNVRAVIQEEGNMRMTWQMNTRMTPETLKLLRNNAVQDSISQSDYLTKLLEKDTLLRARRRAK